MYSEQNNVEVYQKIMQIRSDILQI